ncbi:MAG: FecR domain-containing protein [Asticcacaulis sp.]
MPQAVSDDVVILAAEWIGLLDSDEASDADRQACENWCAANVTHRAVYERMRTFHDKLDSREPAQGRVLKKLSGKKRASHRSAAIYGVTVLVFAGLSGLIWQSDTVQDYFPDHVTSRGQIQTVTLRDGSTVTLDTDTSVRITEGRNHDRIRVVSGRVFANVKHRGDRKFVVDSRFGSATALGTAYEVELKARAMNVSVSESRVLVCPAKQSHLCQTLSAGQRARVTREQVVRLKDAAPTRIAIWSSGWIQALDNDLVTIVGELNRYRTTAIRFERNALKSHKVSGLFPISDPDAALRGVATSSGTRIVRNNDGSVSLRD